MCQGGSCIQDRQTKRGDSTDKESIGMMMEKYTLGNGRMTIELKEICMSCNRMALTHYKILTMMKERQRQRQKK